MAYVHQPQQRPTRYTGCEKYDHIACRSPSDISLWLHVKNGKIFRTGLGSLISESAGLHSLRDHIRDKVVKVATAARKCHDLPQTDLK